MAMIVVAMMPVAVMVPIIHLGNFRVGRRHVQPDGRRGSRGTERRHGGKTAKCGGGKK